MVSFKPHNPYCITLITTYRCNAACVDCCFGCRPDRGRTMTLEEMKHYVDVCIEAYPQSIIRLALTGGECFLLGDDLDEIVRYGTDKGLKVDFMSNGFWGKTYRIAEERIYKLWRAGLKEVGFTMGEDHDHIINFKNCRNAVVASARLGYKVELRIERKPFGDNTVFEKLKADRPLMKLVDSGKIQIKFWEWRDYNNETIHKRRYASHYRPYAKSKPCERLFREIVITPYGDVLACCGIGNSRNPHMRLGNIWKEPVKIIYERSFADLLKIWIQSKGAQEVLQYVYDKSDIKFHQWGNGCDACIEIFENPQILPFLREHYDDWCNKFYYTL